MQRFCQNEQIELLTAQSAIEALALLEQEPIAVIISDYQMPAMNGLDLLEQVRLRWPQTVRIILSGFVSLPIINQALQRGDIYAFLSKPWSRDELKALIAAAFSHYNNST